MADKKVVYQGSSEDVIWKSPVTTLLPDTKIFARKDCIILFFRQGTLMGAFSDNDEYYIVNEDTGGFKTFLGSKKGVDHCAVYYINRNKHIQVKWGTPHRIDVHDKGFDMYTSVGAHGTYSFTILNPLKLFSKMKIFEESLTKDMINQFFSEEITMYLRQSITKAFSQNEQGLRDIAQITSQETKIAHQIKDILAPLFYSYGVKLEKFVISKIDYDRAFLNKIQSIRQEAVMNKYSQENKLVKDHKEVHNRCQVCGHKNSKDAAFCSNCGSKLKTEQICTKCGQSLGLDDKFCFHCGTKVEEE